MDDPWLPSGSGTNLAAISIRVRRTFSAGDDGRWLGVLPNVRCLEIVERLGPSWPTATFRYVLGQTAPAGGPSTAIEALDSGYAGPYFVEPGDVLVVDAYNPTDAEWQPIFHGIVVSFDLDESPGREMAVFHALGAARAAFDRPMGGMVLCDRVTDPDALTAVETQLPARFNARGRQNATIDTDTINRFGVDSWVFSDPRGATDDPATAEAWTIGKAVAYLVTEGHRGGEGLAERGLTITIPDPEAVKISIYGRNPISGAHYDPGNAETFQIERPLAKDIVLTGRAWPELVQTLIEDQGYSIRWSVVASGDEVETKCEVIHLPTDGDEKDLYLQAGGGNLSLDYSNAASIRLSRDLNDAANRIEVHGAPKRYECAIILYPGFEMSADDDNSDVMPDWSAAEITPGTVAWDAYRLFVAAEDGGPWFEPGSSIDQTSPIDLSPVLGEPVDDVPLYCRGPRPALGRLISTDSDGKPLRAELHVSTDWSPDSPGPQVWDGETPSSWQPCLKGWELLTDRLGVRITCEHPNSWQIGPSTDSSHPFPSGVVPLVERLANANDLYLRLTCVIEADEICRGVAERTESAGLPHDITRVIDARERLRYEAVHESSPYYVADNQTRLGFVEIRDDTADAEAEARVYREASESGVMGGTITIPRFTAWYELGDRIRGVVGQTLSFRTDGGGRAPVYPVVVARKWSLGDTQTTTLQISDARKLRRLSRRRSVGPTVDND
jgi:hypothetical protein